MEILKHRLVDYDYTGGFDTSGYMKILYDADAVENALKMWIVSLTGDIVRYGGYGGYIYSALGRTLNEDTADDIRLIMLQGLEVNFAPYLEVLELNVTPNYEEKLYEIQLDAYTPQYNFDINFTGGLPTR